ncbi:unnamed protein product [Protopolystoma xenopodis]|uniref:Uncharacterized protein n=1 Tax=Protopolystoma xenopodis TaxID=117903 RepID=A0A448WIA5_9PLAT|nr:unnamed protein product [Protopolystoma xenopodis]
MLSLIAPSTSIEARCTKAPSKFGRSPKEPRINHLPRPHLSAQAFAVLAQHPALIESLEWLELMPRDSSSCTALSGSCAFSHLSTSTNTSSLASEWDSSATSSKLFASTLNCPPIDALAIYSPSALIFSGCPVIHLYRPIPLLEIVPGGLISLPNLPISRLGPALPTADQDASSVNAQVEMELYHVKRFDEALASRARLEGQQETPKDSLQITSRSDADREPEQPIQFQHPLRLRSNLDSAKGLYYELEVLLYPNEVRWLPLHFYLKDEHRSANPPRSPDSKSKQPVSRESHPRLFILNARIEMAPATTSPVVLAALGGKQGLSNSPVHHFAQCHGLDNIISRYGVPAFSGHLLFS